MAISARLRGLLLLAAGLGLFALVMWLADLEGALAALRSGG